MLWVVVDSLRSPLILNGAAADRAGGRIWKQAERVMAEIRHTAVKYAAEREAACCAAAAANPNLEAAGLTQKLAAISAAEQKRCDELRREVYEGLYELAAVPHSAPHQALMDPPMPHDDMTPSGPSSTGVRYEWLIPPPSAEPKEVPAIPADLCATLNRDALQRLFSEGSDFFARSYDGDPEQWWSSCLPALVNTLTRDLARASDDVDYSRQQMHIARQEAAAARIEGSESRQELREELLSCENEIDELRLKLDLSEAKVGVLSDVLSRNNA